MPTKFSTVSLLLSNAKIMFYMVFFRVALLISNDLEKKTWKLTKVESYNHWFNMYISLNYKIKQNKYQ